jgi:hypothetical protein
MHVAQKCAAVLGQRHASKQSHRPALRQEAKVHAPGKEGVRVGYQLLKRQGRQHQADATRDQYGGC